MNKFSLSVCSIAFLVISADIALAQQSGQNAPASTPSKPAAATPANTATHRGSGPGIVGGSAPNNAGKIGGSSFRLKH